MVERIFHPIGQGAFYSERHNGFNMVYDCGGPHNSTRAERLVKQSFQKSDVIDFLFISHFDADHVNQIETLKNHCALIKTVVLPLLKPDEKKLISNFYQCINNAMVPLINDPNAFFGEETTVVYVLPFDSEEIIDTPEVPIGQLRNNQEIDSGTKIRKDTSWYYIPFNLEFKNRHQELVELLNDASIDQYRLMDDVNYALANRNILKSIYKQIQGDINQNSMFVYSGPINPPIKHIITRSHKYCSFGLHPFLPYTDRFGCIYTGDGNLNKAPVTKLFQNQLDFVGTIQVPHHGDFKSFHAPSFDLDELFCPISFGSTNNYGHPSFQTLKALVGQDNYVIGVTENPIDTYIEIIET